MRSYLLAVLVFGSIFRTWGTSSDAPKTDDGVVVALEGQSPVKLEIPRGGGDGDVTTDLPKSSMESSKKSLSQPRKGVVWDSSETATTTTTTTSSAVSENATTVRRRKKKPLFTMVLSESEKNGGRVSSSESESESGDSFIESSTTGRDFVFPIVLAILVFPLVLLFVVFVYRRGTEFSERQQYRRMYLIDGMYNSR